MASVSPYLLQVEAITQSKAILEEEKIQKLRCIRSHVTKVINDTNVEFHKKQIIISRDEFACLQLPTNEINERAAFEMMPASCDGAIPLLREWLSWNGITMLAGKGIHFESYIARMLDVQFLNLENISTPCRARDEEALDKLKITLNFDPCCGLQDLHPQDRRTWRYTFQNIAGIPYYPHEEELQGKNLPSGRCERALTAIKDWLQWNGIAIVVSKVGTLNVSLQKRLGSDFWILSLLGHQHCREILRHS
eukprot:gene6336-7062_t